MGNLMSVQKALEKLGFEAVVTDSPEEVSQAEKLILPGVGAFAAAVQNVDRRGLRHCLTKAVLEGRHLLGICLGLQLRFPRSEEDGAKGGLGFLEGVNVKFGSGVKVPHIGWNEVRRNRESPLFAGIPDGAFFYFVHSYFPEPEVEEDNLAWSDHGRDFTAAVNRGNLWGVQFHPEKSQRWGLKLLENFCRLD